MAGVRVVRDHEVAPGQGPLDVRVCGRLGVASSVDRLARAQQRLGRDARPVGALPADELTLDQGHAKATFGQGAGTVLARRAAADDDDVEVAAHLLPRSVRCVLECDAVPSTGDERA
jgi:hypothetical protein